MDIIIAMELPNDAIWHTRKQAAAYLTAKGCRVTERSLIKYANRDNSGKGPVFYRNGGNRVVYDQTDLDAWRAQRMKRIE